MWKSDRLPGEQKMRDLLIGAKSKRRPKMRTKAKRFDAEKALVELLSAKVLYLNSNWWEGSWPEEARQSFYVGVNCSDAFAWGSADSERVLYFDLESVYEHYRKDAIYGPLIWCMKKRKEMPLKIVEQAIREQGIWDLDAIQKEEGLRPNYFDGISSVMAQMKYEKYLQFKEERNERPLPFDAGWWEGWKEYVEANPLWNSEAWEEEEEQRCNAWRKANGWDEESTSGLKA